MEAHQEVADSEEGAGSSQANEQEACRASVEQDMAAIRSAMRQIRKDLVSFERYVQDLDA